MIVEFLVNLSPEWQNFLAANFLRFKHQMAFILHTTLYSIITLRAKQVGEFIEIRHKKFHPPILHQTLLKRCAYQMHIWQVDGKATTCYHLQ